ncbi:MAG: hypothetical protein R2932_26810 [Caldilineaceae bacterium]
MHKVDHNYPTLETKGLIFYITSYNTVLQDGPAGIFISDDLLKSNTVLRKVDSNGVKLWFAVFNPAMNATEEAPVHAILKLIKQDLPNKSKRGMAASIQIYAELVEEAEREQALLEQAIEIKVDTPEVKEIAHRILLQAYNATVDFVNILRRRYNQYWLLPPNPNLDAGWSYVVYYSRPRKEWYSLIADENFHLPVEPSIAQRREWPGNIIIRAIDEDDMEGLHVDRPEKPFSFAEEIVANALVDLGNARVRSAILHTIIGLESSAKRGLQYLLKNRLAGIEQGAVLEAISREISVVTLARVVHAHILGDESIDWPKINNLYGLRNTIVHRGQKRLPPKDIIKDQILEVFKYITMLEEKIQ